MFNKANEAEQLETARETLKAEIKQLEAEAEPAEGDARKRLKAKIQSAKERLDELLNEESAES